MSMRRRELAEIRRQQKLEHQKRGPAERVLGTKRGRSAAIDFDEVHTRGVLAGAYRGRDIGDRDLLTHLVYRKHDVPLEIVDGITLGDDIAVGCRQPLDHIVDPHSDPAGLHQRPTCPTCAKKWDKLKAEGRI